MCSATLPRILTRYLDIYLAVYLTFWVRRARAGELAVYELAMKPLSCWLHGGDSSLNIWWSRASWFCATTASGPEVGLVYPPPFTLQDIQHSYIVSMFHVDVAGWGETNCQSKSRKYCRNMDVHARHILPMWSLLRHLRPDRYQK